MDSFIKSLCTNVTCLFRQFLQWKGQKADSTKWKVLQDICPESVNRVEKINTQLIYCFDDCLTDRYYAHSYLTCWGYLNTPHEGTNSSLLQANSFPNAKTYVNGIQLLRKKKNITSTLFGYTFLHYKEKLYEEYCLSLWKKSQENHPEYFATISGPSKSISSISKHAIS